MRSVSPTGFPLHRVINADMCWNTKYLEEDLTCSVAAKRKTALSRRRKSPCPEVHLAQQLDAMSLILSAPVVAASSEHEAEEQDVEEALSLVVAGRRAGTEDTDASAGIDPDPAESGS